MAQAQETPTHMSSAEAKARYLAALAACAYSDEQMRLVAGAPIVDGESHLELRRWLAQLPVDQVKVLLDKVDVQADVGLQRWEPHGRCQPRGRQPRR